jgi:hypothetical protein
MPKILGITASSRRAIVAASYDSIATGIGTGSNDTITFSSIPSTYKHLQIRWMSRSGRLIDFDTIRGKFNSDSGTNYTEFHKLTGNGSTVSSSVGTTSNTNFLVGTNSGISISTANYGTGITEILDYTNTNKYKTIRTITGIDQNGSGEMSLVSGLWMSTAAISSITIETVTGNFGTGTSFALYGIRG